MKKIFLLGSSGFIGTNLYQYLKDQYSILKYNKNKNLVKCLKDYKPDIIINCAGETSEISKMFESNTSLTYNILNYCKSKGQKVKYIHIGTSKEYGSVRSKIKENDVLNPRDIYEATKCCSSLLCQGYARYYKLPIIIIKAFSIYGKNQNKNAFISKLIDSCTTGKEIEVSNGKNDFLYIKDLISGIKIFCDINNEQIIGGDIVNLCFGKAYNNKQVVKLISHIFDKNLNIKYINDKTNQKRFSLGDPSYSKIKYGFNPVFDLKDGLIDLKKEH